MNTRPCSTTPLERLYCPNCCCSLTLDNWMAVFDTAFCVRCGMREDPAQLAKAACNLQTCTFPRERSTYRGITGWIPTYIPTRPLWNRTPPPRDDAPYPDARSARNP